MGKRYEQEKQFWNERQLKLQNDQVDVDSGKSRSVLSAAANERTVQALDCLITDGTSGGFALQAQQALLDLATVRHAVRLQLQSLRDEKAALHERKVIIQSQLLDALDSSVQTAIVALESTAADFKCGMRQLEALAGDLQRALHSNDANMCELHCRRAARGIAQVLQQLGDDSCNTAASPTSHPATTLPAEQLSQMKKLAAQVQQAVSSSYPAALTGPAAPRSPAGIREAAPQQAATAGMPPRSAPTPDNCARITRLEGLLPLPADRRGAAALSRLQAALGMHPDLSMDPARFAEATPKPAAYQVDRLRAEYKSMLGRVQVRHEAEVQAMQQQHTEELRRQAAQHKTELEAVKREAQDPGQDAEMCLLRDENARTKERLRSLAADFDSRVQVATHEARCEAELRHQQLVSGLRQECLGLRGEAEQLRGRVAELEAGRGREVADALAAQQGELEAHVAQLKRSQADKMAAMQAQYAELVEERERQHDQLLQELRELRSAACSLAPSRTATRESEEGQETQGRGGAPREGYPACVLAGGQRGSGGTVGGAKKGGAEDGWCPGGGQRYGLRAEALEGATREPGGLVEVFENNLFEQA